MEIEKSLSKSAVSGQGDSGTSSRTFATLLSWLSDHTSPVFVIGTSNDHTKLPVEFVRKGRFDEIFWLDLPTEAERKEIFKVLLARYGRDASKLKLNLDKLAEKTDLFTGAEIEQIIISAMYSQFSDSGKEINQISLMDEIAAAVPFGVTNKEELQIMRDKAAGRLRVASSSGTARIFEPTTEQKSAERKIDTESL